MDDFHYLMQKNVNALTDIEKTKLANIRNSIPKPDANTLMQKVIDGKLINKYLDGSYNTVGGYVSRAVDSKHLKNVEDYFYGLRLDYIKTPFDAGDEFFYIIRFKTDELDNLVIPIDGKFSNYDYPFTRNGFTSGNQGRLGVPEYVFDNKVYVTPKEGAEIWKVNHQGEVDIIAVFKDGKFNELK